MYLRGHFKAEKLSLKYIHFVDIVLISLYEASFLSLSQYEVALKNRYSSFEHCIIRTSDEMTFPYKHVLMIGATAGIGKALASHLVESGIKATAVSRRQERLEKFVKQYGCCKAKGIMYDVAVWEKASNFAEE